MDSNPFASLLARMAACRSASAEDTPIALCVADVTPGSIRIRARGEIPVSDRCARTSRCTLPFPCHPHPESPWSGALPWRRRTEGPGDRCPRSCSATITLNFVAYSVAVRSRPSGSSLPSSRRHVSNPLAPHKVAQHKREGFPLGPPRVAQHRMWTNLRRRPLTRAGSFAP